MRNLFPSFKLQLLWTETVTAFENCFCNCRVFHITAVACVSTSSAAYWNLSLLFLVSNAVRHFYITHTSIVRVLGWWSLQRNDFYVHHRRPESDLKCSSRWKSGFLFFCFAWRVLHTDCFWRTICAFTLV